MRRLQLRLCIVYNGAFYRRSSSLDRPRIVGKLTTCRIVLTCLDRLLSVDTLACTQPETSQACVFGRVLHKVGHSITLLFLAYCLFSLFLFCRPTFLTLSCCLLYRTSRHSLFLLLSLLVKILEKYVFVFLHCCKLFVLCYTLACLVRQLRYLLT